MHSVIKIILAAGVISAAFYTQAGLKLFYSMDKLAGRKVFDQSPGRLNGWLYPARVSKKLPVLADNVPEPLAKRSRHSLKNTGGYVLMKRGANLELNDQFTFNVWVNFSDLKGRLIGIIGQRNGFASMNWMLFYRPSHQTLMFWAGANAKYRLFSKSKTVLLSGKWYMLTVVRNKDELLLYLNGKEHLKAQAKGDFGCKSYLSVGALDAGGNSPMNGFIDEFAIWDEALDAAKIMKLYGGIDPLSLVKGSSSRWNYAKPGTTETLPEPALRPRKKKEIIIYGNKKHPSCGISQTDINRAKLNIKKYAWARQYFAKTLKAADWWTRKPASYWLQFLPEPGACYAYGFTGCPICGSGWGIWARARCSWDSPGQVKCHKGHSMPDSKHPDKGSGFVAKTGKVHYFKGSWNAWVTEQWTRFAIPVLVEAYAITGKDKYAELAVSLLDGLASIYSESTTGSWDYPSYQVGRLARPNYQVARNLIKYAGAYDLLYNYKGMDKPSLKKGFSRRKNIEENMLLDGAYFCYSHSFSNSLHNGHADYLRGALAVGCLLHIPEYISAAVYGPFSIMSMINNNVDRDGGYYETTLSYGEHARRLYLDYAELLRYYRSSQLPEGINLYNNQKFINLLKLPNLSFTLSGHRPNFGDASPDTFKADISSEPYNATDHLFAEMVYAGTTRPEIKKEFGNLLKFLSRNAKEDGRGQLQNKEWLLFHADSVLGTAKNTAVSDIIKKSRLFGQKGVAVLRNGDGNESQGALLRYGPTLTHGDFDELGLLYYAKGRQLTYDLGYGLASTHTQTGWTSQTGSHTVVTVNEKSQLEAPGTGGSLYLFAEMPGLQLVEAGAPLAYASENVKQYRRTVALLGHGKNQVLVDIFRVKGGWQHDYIVGTYGKRQKISGVKLQSVKGSLAGKNIYWGSKQGKDGDIIGYPGKPYWNPPPRNGYGFIENLQKGRSCGAWNCLWKIGDVMFKLHLLSVEGSDAIIGEAPGLYPAIPRASYAIWRRKGLKTKQLDSCFVSVMEPYGGVADAPSISALSLGKMAVDGNAPLKSLVSKLGILLIRGNSPGAYASFNINVEKNGSYFLNLKIRKAPPYGDADIFLNGKKIGEVNAYDEKISDIQSIALGKFYLRKGKQELKIKLKQGKGGGYMFGIAGLDMKPANYRKTSRSAESILLRSERVPVRSSAKNQLTPAAVKLVYRSGKVAYVISSSTQNSPVSIETVYGGIRFKGGYLVVEGNGQKVNNVSGCAVEALSIGDKKYTLPASYSEGRIQHVDIPNSMVRIIFKGEKIPERGTVIFNSPAYTRNTAYRFRLKSRKGNTAVLDLLGRSVILGQGATSDIVGRKLIKSNVPHEYGRKLIHRHISKNKREIVRESRFFEGKEILGENGQKTVVTQAKLMYNKPFILHVEDSSGLKKNEKFEFIDIKAGDTLKIISGFEK
jgi:hypothetical protein